MNAYNEPYLDDAMSSMGAMLDFAVGRCREDLSDFYQKFLTSGIDRQLDEWNPKYVSGMSGIELARCVYSRIGSPLPEGDGLIDMGSPEYWAGWTIAWIHGKLDIDYRALQNRGLPIRLIYERYSVLHEADLTKTLAFAQHALAEHAVKENPLRRARKNIGMTQQQLAEQSGSSLRTIRAYEQGQLSLQNASLENALRICRVLGCSVRDILPACPS